APHSEPEDAFALAALAHDHQQLDLQVYRVRSAQQPASEALELELYFFIPRNIGINAGNYSRTSFYADLTSFVRVDLPRLSMAELASLAAPSSPLFELEQQLLALCDGSEPAATVALKAQLFGHAFAEAARAA